MHPDTTARPPRRRLALAIGLLLVAAVAAGVVVTVGSGGEDSAADGAVGVAPAATAARVAVAADIGSDAQGQATLAAMGEAAPDLHVFLGDLSYAGPESEETWCDLVHRALETQTPAQVLAGNHEDDTGEDGRIDAFAQCLPDRMGSRGQYGREYFFDVGRLARFILVSPDLTIEGEHYFYGDGNAHEKWLVQAIDGAREAGISWVVVGMHKNCLSVGEYYCNVYQDMLDLLVEKRVDLVLHGHDHSYQRSKQLVAPRTDCPQVVVDAFDPDCVVDDGSDGTYARGEGPVFVITGMGGGELYALNADDAEAGYFAATMGQGPGGRFGFITLDLSEDALRVAFAPSSPGTFSDSFALR